MDGSAIGADNGFLDNMADSHQMDKARLKNLSIEKKLKDKLADYKRELEANTSRIRTEQRCLWRSLTEMKQKPNGPGSNAIMPRGLSQRQIEMLRASKQLQRVRSLTLAEFDVKLHKLLAERKVTRSLNFCRHSDPNSGHHFLAPNAETARLDTGFHFELKSKPGGSDRLPKPTTAGRMPNLLTSPRYKRATPHQSSRRNNTGSLTNNASRKKKKEDSTKASVKFNPLLSSYKPSSNQSPDYSSDDELEDLKAEVNFPHLSHEEKVMLGYVDVSMGQSLRPHTTSLPGVDATTHNSQLTVIRQRTTHF